MYFVFYLDADFPSCRRSIAGYVTEIRRERCAKEMIKDMKYTPTGKKTQNNSEYLLIRLYGNYFGKPKTSLSSFICASVMPSGSKPMFLAAM